MSHTDDTQSLWILIGLPFYSFAGAVVVGIAVAWVASKTAQMLRDEDEHYRFAIIIGAVMLSLGVCGSLGMSALFAPLILGIATRWFETRANRLSHVGLGEGGDLFFIVLFVMAGAKIDFAQLWMVGLLPLALSASRIVAKIAGVQIVGIARGVAAGQSFAVSLMLLPLAGMAIGLVAMTNAMAPVVGQTVSTLVFAMVAVFEAIGPFAVTYALRSSGEAGKRPTGEAEEIEDASL
jgi:Kef-type K+ transport system membrane component KefB